MTTLAVPSVKAALDAHHQPPAASSSLLISGLRKSYTVKDGEQRALRDVTFMIRAGEFAFICGPTGSGKTTLLHLIRGQLAPDSGSILLGGIPIEKLDQRAFRRKLGFVSQDFDVLPRLTVAENIAYPLQTLRHKPHMIERRVKELLATFDLGHAAKRLANASLSGGERQRLAIARAIAHSPDLLLCDEPTGNLDAATTWGVMKTLNRVSTVGTTVLCVTHDPMIVNMMHKRVLVVANGVIASDTVGGYRLD